MNCEKAEPLFSDQIDGTLDSSTTFGLQAHLSFCPNCRATFSAMTQVRKALRRIGATSSPASFKLQLSNRLEEELQRRGWAWKRSRAWAVVLAAALAILLRPETEAARADAASGLRQGEHTARVKSGRGHPSAVRIREAYTRPAR